MPFEGVSVLNSRSPALKSGRLQRGHYALICNLSGYYEAGMHSDFEVK